MEEETQKGYEEAKGDLRRYLEHDSTSHTAANVWRMLAQCCFKTNDLLGDIQALLQRSKISSVPFVDLANTAGLFHKFLRKQVLNVGLDEKKVLAQDLLAVMEQRIGEARADDLGQMAWLAVCIHENAKAREFVQQGLKLEPENYHLLKIQV